jgi:predicted small integral membrane protein
MVMMVMPMIVRVPMVMVMGMGMGMVMSMMVMVETAGPGAEMIAKRAILDIASRRRDALPLDMMVVAFLGQPHLALKPQNL